MDKIRACRVTCLASPLLPVHQADGRQRPPVLDRPCLGALDATLGHVEGNVDTAAESAGSQTEANLPAELQSGVRGTWQPAFHRVIETKVNHVEETIPSHGGRNSFS